MNVHDHLKQLDNKEDFEGDRDYLVMFHEDNTTVVYRGTTARDEGSPDIELMSRIQKMLAEDNTVETFKKLFLFTRQLQKEQIKSCNECPDHGDCDEANLETEH